MGQVEWLKIKVAWPSAVLTQRLSTKLSPKRRREPPISSAGLHRTFLTVSNPPPGWHSSGAPEPGDKPPVPVGSRLTPTGASRLPQGSGLRICSPAPRAALKHRTTMVSLPAGAKPWPQAARRRRGAGPALHAQRERQAVRPITPHHHHSCSHEVTQAQTAAGPEGRRSGRSRWRPGPREAPRT